MKKIDKIENKIVFAIKKLLKNKPKGHHDPIFAGNEKKYHLIQKQNMPLQLHQEHLLYT